MRIAHGADVANQKTVFEIQLLSHFHRCRIEPEKIGLHSILDNGNLCCGNVPVPDQVILEGWRHDDYAVGATVKESGDGAQRAMEQCSFAARADGRERFRPKIAHFEDERNALPPRQPPSRKRNQQLRRRGDDHLWLRQRQPAERSRDTERCVIADSFVRLSVGQRPQPRANNAHSIDGFRVMKSAQPRTPLLGHDAGRMVRKSSEDRHFMPHPRPMP